jgi:hypothetical protein
MHNTDRLEKIARTLTDIAKSCADIRKAAASAAEDASKAGVVDTALRELADQLEDIARQLRT